MTIYDHTFLVSQIKILNTDEEEEEGNIYIKKIWIVNEGLKSGKLCLLVVYPVILHCIPLSGSLEKNIILFRNV